MSGLLTEVLLDLDVGALFIILLGLLDSVLDLVTDCLPGLTGLSDTALILLGFSLLVMPLLDFPLTGAAGFAATFFGRALVRPFVWLSTWVLVLLLTSFFGAAFAGDFTADGFAAGDFTTGFFAAGFVVLSAAFATGFFIAGFVLLAATGLVFLATGLPVDFGLALTEFLVAALTAGLMIFLTKVFSFAVFFVAISGFLLRRCFDTHDLY